MKLKEFIKKYKTIIFDMDGVITSEQNYWDIAALACYEMLYSNKYYGDGDIDVLYMSQNIKKIRAEVFAGDKIIYRIKDIGINSNWDLVYVTVALKMKYGSFDEVYMFLRDTNLDVNGLYDMCALIFGERLKCGHANALRNAGIWHRCVNCFQEWYLGDDEFESIFKVRQVQRGKVTMRFNEVPLLDNELLRRLFELLKAEGISLGVATGRPQLEMETPLKLWDMEKYFDKNRRISYTYVMNAEKKYKIKNVGLTKPHPYMFVKSALGDEFSDEKIINGDYNISDDVLFVGDAGADILAANTAHVDFLAVMTGAMGKKSRTYFEKMGATYILNKLTDLIED